MNGCTKVQTVREKKKKPTVGKCRQVIDKIPIRKYQT